MKRRYFEINEGWSFSYNGEEPRTVSIPHTWNSGEVGGYRQGVGVYERTVDIERCEGRRLYIELDGANTIAELWINDNYVGKHEGGYSRFRFDITDYVISGENSFKISVDNRPTAYVSPIDNCGDFTKMGGIYRKLRLVEVDDTHIDLEDYGSSGVYISTDGCKVNLLVKTVGYGETEVKVKIVDNSGLVAEEAKAASLNGKGEVSFCIDVENPTLWQGVENPYLYECRVSVGDDEVTQHFGFREYHIDPEEGFFLNGKHICLHGVNYHQDSYESGWAMDDIQRNRDWDIMRNLGCNAIRMAHYQHCEDEYDLCDRYGICAWTEVGLVNKMSAEKDLTIDPRFRENVIMQLKELILQNYNHPSVIVWGLFNELWQMSDEILDIFSSMNDVAKALDPKRLTVYADCQFWGEFLKLPADVVGVNRYFGWYKDAGSSDKFGKWLDGYRAKVPIKGICMSEYGGGGAISQHKDNIDWENEIDPWGERHYENYQNEMHEEVYPQFEARKWIWAHFVWCGFDFSSAGRREGDTVGLNDKGLCTHERMPKDAYFYYKSKWNDEPMLHLCDKRFVERADVAPIVKAYSTVGQVELFVGGRSCGVGCNSPENPTVYVWRDVALEKGENLVEIKACHDEMSDGCVWEVK